jgi:hypothetical protein
MGSGIYRKWTSDRDVLNAAAFDREVMARGKNEANGAV